MSIYRRPDSDVYWYDITVKGRRLRGSTGETAAEAARLVEANARREAAASAPRADRRLTLDQAAARYWLEHAATLPSSATIDLWIRNLLAGLGGGTWLDQLTDDQVAQWVARRRGTIVHQPKARPGEPRPEPRRIANATVNRELATLRAILTMAARCWGAPVATIAWRAHALREAAPRARYLTAEDAQRLLEAAAPHLRPAIELSLLTGIRLANCVRLDWAQVDLAGATLNLRVKSMTAAGGKPHRVPLAPPAVALLANLAPDFSPAGDARKRRGRVFLYTPPRPGAVPRPIKTWRTAWRAACRRADIADFRWHDLRHTCASWLVQRGVPLEVVREILGHADIGTTLRYAHHADDAARRAVAQLGQILSPTAAPADPPRHVSPSRRATGTD